MQTLFFSQAKRRGSSNCVYYYFFFMIRKRVVEMILSCLGGMLGEVGSRANGCAVDLQRPADILIWTKYMQTSEKRRLNTLLRPSLAQWKGYYYDILTKTRHSSLALISLRSRFSSDCRGKKTLSLTRYDRRERQHSRHSDHSAVELFSLWKQFHSRKTMVQWKRGLCSELLLCVTMYWLCFYRKGLTELMNCLSLYA